MALNPKLVQHGIVNGNPLNVDMARLEHGAPVKVQLTAAYTIFSGAGTGIPHRPSFTGAAAASLDYPRTIPSGTKLFLLAGEANALIAAGAATLTT